MKTSSGLLIVLVIVVIGLLGGFKNSKSTKQLNSGNFPSQTYGNFQSNAVLGGTPTSKETKNIQQQISSAEYKVKDLQKQVAAEQLKKISSEYRGIVHIQYVNR